MNALTDCFYLFDNPFDPDRDPISNLDMRAKNLSLAEELDVFAQDELVHHFISVGVFKEALTSVEQFLDWLDPRTLGQALDGSMFESWSTDALLRRIRCPVQLLVGEAALGGAIELGEAKRAENQLAYCQTVFMKGVGHNIQFEQPDAFSSAVRQFLDAL